MKLLVEEPESEALTRWLREHPVGLLVSALGRVEVVRTVRLLHDSASTRSELEALFEDVATLAVTTAVRLRAEEVSPRLLRTLDAVHVASALEAGLREMLVYDRRLAAAAGENGIAVFSPGAP